MPDNTTTADSMAPEYGAKHGCGMKKRPWSLPEIAIVVGGFIFFWPVGLAALAVKLFKGELWRGSSEYAAPWKDKSPDEMMGAARDWRSKWHQPASSGNAAFDEYRKTQLERLEAERRKLEEEQKAFGEYLAKLRRAKDQDEFDRFMAERTAKPQGE